MQNSGEDRIISNAFQDWVDAWIILYLWRWSFNPKKFLVKNGYHLHTLILMRSYKIEICLCMSFVVSPESASFLLKMVLNVASFHWDQTVKLPNLVVFAKIHCQHC